PFHRESGGPVSVPLMAQTNYYDYAQTATFQAVALPYGAGRMQMIVLLPRPGVKLDALVKSLDAKTWAAMVGALNSTHVALRLPRFRVSYDGQMTAPLSALGMGAAFAPSADFAPMGLPAGNGLTGVLHKAVMEVNEEGTVAAAVTAIGVGAGAPSPVTEMRVDHPFVCAIRDTGTGTLLFVGAIRDPE
ncbi:MAG: serpin family protein, partial [Armatimonadota bacterium]|nr:serpin family protein [Armatimonadota bacterium]